MTMPNPNPLPGPPTLDIPAVYRRAAEVLDERGWCQDTAQDMAGRVCAFGALRIAYGWSPCKALSSLAELAEEDALLKPLHDHLPALVVVWNDEEGRTADEVKAALLAVAEKYASVGPSVVWRGGRVEVTQP